MQTPDLAQIRARCLADSSCGITRSNLEERSDDQLSTETCEAIKMSDLRRSLNDEVHLLDICEKRNSRIVEELQEYKGQSLSFSIKHNGKRYYYKYSSGGGRKKYLGGELNEEVQRIKSLHHAEKTLEVVSRNKKLILPLAQQYQGVSYDEINDLLPNAYKCNVSTAVCGTDSRALKWKQEKEAFKNDYLRNNPEKYPKSFRYQRRNGQWMRSKSEGSIADILDMNGLTFVYELPHLCNGIWIKSDFTVLSPLDFESEIIIEHAGRMDIENYRNKFIYVLEAYMKEGYRPNIDLFFTFDNLDGTFSQIPVQNIIDNWLGAAG